MSPLWNKSALLTLTVILSLQCVLQAFAQGGFNVNDEKVAFDVKMRGINTKKNDEYKCTSYEMPKDDAYIVQFKPLADASVAHHILMYGCREPHVSKPGATWTCGRACASGEQILFAWAKNAPELDLPSGVGFHVGGSSKVKHIVLQVHYAKKMPDGADPDHSGIRLYMTQQKQKYEAGIFLLLAYAVTIPANTQKKHADISCTYHGSGDMYPFGYRTHAHSLGRVISGYKVGKENKFSLIGKGNPQWPQSFYKVKNKVVIKPGDKLVGRCTYNSTGRNRVTYIGATASDEMCNFYIMYYKDPNTRIAFPQCVGNRIPDLVDRLPADSDTPLPHNATLEAYAMGHHHSHMGGHIDNEEPEILVNNAPARLQTGGEDAHNYVAFQSDFASSTNTVQSGASGLTGKDFPIGQVGGVASDAKGNVYVFHRGSRVWDYSSFDFENNFQQKDSPITEATIIVYDKDSKIIRKFGENLFFMPHGISVDSQNNIWVTDVGLHQVMKFPAGSDKPDAKTLGVRFEPGSDKNHYCKPTDVVVLSSGEVFVSDGYCNSRIMKYDKNLNLIKIFGNEGRSSLQSDGFPQPGFFSIPHSLALAEDKGLLCVADRENGRIQCYDFQGNFQKQMHPKEFGPRLFAIEYCPLHGGLIFAVNGPTVDKSSTKVQGFIININSGELLETWNTQQGLQNPHDVTVDLVHLRVYVGELTPPKVWRFDMLGETGSIAKTPSPTITKAPVTSAQPTVTTTVGSTEIPSNAKKGQQEEGEDTVVPAIIIGALLIIPVIIIIIVVVIVRVYKRGQYYCCRRHRSHSRKKFNLGDILSPHRGFDKLSQEESENEIDLSDSDQEEYSITQKA